jgi:hypothetical protein
MMKKMKNIIAVFGTSDYKTEEELEALFSAQRRTQYWEWNSVKWKPCGLFGGYYLVDGIS